MQYPTRAITTVLYLSLAPATVAAQGDARAQRIYAENLQRKLSSPWLERCDWILEWDAALARARKKRKPVLAFFTRSYTQCRSCERFERAALSDPAFKTKLSKDVVLFAHVTSRVKGRGNDGLLRRLFDRDEVWPTIAFIDGEGEILYEHPAAKNKVTDLQASLGNVKRLLKAKAKGNSASARIDLLITKIELGMLEYEAALAARRSLTRVPRGKQKKLRGLLAKLEFEDLRARRLPQAELARHLVAMKDAGRIPVGDQRWLFYWYILEQAGRDKNARLFEQCLNKVKELKNRDKAFQSSITVKEAQLQKLKSRKR